MCIENKKKLYPLADKILQAILESSEKPKYLSENQKEAIEHLKENYSQFEKGLNENQKKLLQKIEDTSSSIEGLNQVYRLLEGMSALKKLQDVINFIAENPLEVVKYYDDKTR